MIGEQQINEIFAQYKKHGWNLRRVLLSAETSEKMPASMFNQTKVVSSKIDAAWFSRASTEGREAWELRSLSTTPFAFVEVFEADDEEAAREEARREMETRLIEQASNIGKQKTEN